MEKKKVYTISNAHLDTIWSWDFETTVGQYIRRTLTDNFELFEKALNPNVQAVLVNSTEANPSGFTFEIDNEAIAKITAQTATGLAYVKPVSSGQAQITITNTATEISKQVLVVVGNSEEELAGFTYLTTSSNVVSIGLI